MGSDPSSACLLSKRQLLQGLDAYELAEPVDVVKQLDKAFWEGLASAKWTERRNALQRLRAITANPRLATGDLANVLRELKKIVGKDSNVVCVAESIACVGAFALHMIFIPAGHMRCKVLCSCRAWWTLASVKIQLSNFGRLFSSH